MNRRPLEPTETETMTQPEDRDSVYNTYGVWKPAPAAKHKLSPRAKAGLAAGGVALASTAMFAWSQYETGQANASVAKAQIALEQTQADVQLEQQQAQQAKASGQETAAQKARREAIQACIAAAGNSFNGVSDCASAYPVVDSAGALNSSQSVASTTPTSGANSGTGLIVLGGLGAVAAFGWAKKRFARS
jgi:hypothetical protein